MKLILTLALVAALGVPASADDGPDLITAGDLADFPDPDADARLAYGPGPLQFGDLRLPEGDGPHPVVVFIHGGCWLAEYDIAHSSKLTEALTGAGVAVWSLEYRRVGDEDGAWPATFTDIARGADHLRELAPEYGLDLERVIAMGHSAGGHLALWLAARADLPEDSPLAVAEPMPIGAVLALAPAADLGHLHAEDTCGGVIGRLLGGSPEEHPDRYRWTDPTRFATQTTPQVLVIGTHDAWWAPVGRRYHAASVARGDDVRLVEATASGHFEMIDPDSTTWPLVRDLVRELTGLSGR